MRNSKRLYLVLLFFVTLSTLCSCNFYYNRWQWFTLKNNIKVKVTLNALHGLNMKSDKDRFTITKKKKEIGNAIFIEEEDKNKYVESVKSDNTAKILKNDSYQFFWTVNGEAGQEFNRILDLPGCESYLLIACPENEKTANEIFNSIRVDVYDLNEKFPSTKSSKKSNIKKTSEVPYENSNDKSQGTNEAVNYIKEQLKYMSFSRKGLLEMMKLGASEMPHATEKEYEEALQYVEDNNIVDWNKEAEKRAIEYSKENTNYTKDFMKDMLIHGDEFTEEQAQHAIDVVFGKN